MSTEDFVTYEQAIALKKLGFKEKCLYHYNICNKFEPNSKYGEDESINVEDLYDSINTDTLSDIVCDVPTLAQAQKWLIKNKNYYVQPRYEYNKEWGFTITNLNKDYIIYIKFGTYKTHEEALSAGITRGLKLLER